MKIAFYSANKVGPQNVTP